MRKENYIQPALNLDAFNCSKCHVYSKQTWFNLHATRKTPTGGVKVYDDRNFFKISNCECCGFPTIWHEAKMIYPLHSSAEPPSEDMPKDIRSDFEEARLIANLSPRGAAALLRLAIQKLCVYLGQPGKNINSDIAGLVNAGLPQRVQQALDSVRVIGNDAVHPGTIDLRDDPEIANKLFRLVNFIIDKTITEPKEVESLYNGLPQEKLDGIERRKA